MHKTVASTTSSTIYAAHSTGSLYQPSITGASGGIGGSAGNIFHGSGSSLPSALLSGAATICSSNTAIDSGLDSTSIVGPSGYFQNYHSHSYSGEKIIEGGDNGVLGIGSGSLGNVPFRRHTLGKSLPFTWQMQSGAKGSKVLSLQRQQHSQLPTQLNSTGRHQNHGQQPNRHHHHNTLLFTSSSTSAGSIQFDSIDTSLSTGTDGIILNRNDSLDSNPASDSILPLTHSKYSGPSPTQMMVLGGSSTHGITAGSIVTNRSGQLGQHNQMLTDSMNSTFPLYHHHNSPYHRLRLRDYHHRFRLYKSLSSSEDEVRSTPEQLSTDQEDFDLESECISEPMLVTKFMTPVGTGHIQQMMEQRTSTNTSVTKIKPDDILDAKMKEFLVVSVKIKYIEN